MTRWLWALLLLALAPAASAGPDARSKPKVQVTVTRVEGGDWLIEYDFKRRSPVWFFPRSASDLAGKPWRPQSWTVETLGVRLERAGFYDVLVASGAPLRRVRIRMRPFAEPLTADYTPALAFSDGGLALFTDHFAVLPRATRAEVAALPSDLNGVPGEQPQIALTLNDPGRRLLVHGRAIKGSVRVTLGTGLADDGTYIYSGDAPLVETPAFAGVLDVGLPTWVRGELDGFTPRLFRLYTDRLGPPNGNKPMALVAWQGAERNGWSLGGSVLSGMVVMQISGKRVLESAPDILARTRWFIGHESAHFWLGQTIRYSRESDGWIMEGGADLLAVRALQQLVPDYDPRTTLQSELDDCLARNGAGKPLAKAQERGDHRAFYACGAMLMMAAESVARRSGGDLFGFVRALIAARHPDGTIDTGDWLAAFEAAGGNPALSTEIRAFLDRGVPDPRAFWTRLLAATGVDFTRDGDRLLLA